MSAAPVSLIASSEGSMGASVVKPLGPLTRGHEGRARARKRVVLLDFLGRAVPHDHFAGFAAARARSRSRR